MPVCVTASNATLKQHTSAQFKRCRVKFGLLFDKSDTGKCVLSSLRTTTAPHPLSAFLSAPKLPPRYRIGMKGRIGTVRKLSCILPQYSCSVPVSFTFGGERSLSQGRRIECKIRVAKASLAEASSNTSLLPIDSSTSLAI